MTLPGKMPGQGATTATPHDAVDDDGAIANTVPRTGGRELSSISLESARLIEHAHGRMCMTAAPGSSSHRTALQTAEPSIRADLYVGTGSVELKQVLVLAFREALGSGSLVYELPLVAGLAFVGCAARARRRPRSDSTEA
jgi:hypothetical protein